MLWVWNSRRLTQASLSQPAGDEWNLTKLTTASKEIKPIRPGHFYSERRPATSGGLPRDKRKQCLACRGSAALFWAEKPARSRKTFLQNRLADFTGSPLTTITVYVVAATRHNNFNLLKQIRRLFPLKCVPVATRESKQPWKEQVLKILVRNTLHFTRNFCVFNEAQQNKA